MKPQQPAYPFYTRYGHICFKAYLSANVSLTVGKPDEYTDNASIFWNRNRFLADVPRFMEPEHYLANNTDELITRDEFMVAYNAAEAFIQTAAREFLAPVQLITSEQSTEITRLLNHPAFGRTVKTKWLLRVNRLTHADATAAIKVLSDARAMFDGPDLVGEYAVTGEVILISSVAA